MIVCLIILLPSVFFSIPDRKYCSTKLEELVKIEKAQVVEINKKGDIDNYKFIVNRIINTNNDTYIKYTYIGDGFGWPLWTSNFTIIDNENRIYQGVNGGSSEKLWGQQGLIIFERIDENKSPFFLVYNKFDREMKIPISLERKGAGVE